MSDTDDKRNHEWSQDVEIDCISEAYPNDLAELLVTTDDDVRGGDNDELSLGSSDEDTEAPEGRRSSGGSPSKRALQIRKCYLSEVISSSERVEISEYLGELRVLV